MSGSDKPPKAAYDQWAASNNVSTTWAQLTTVQQGIWTLVAQAAINAQNN